jgi:hypothetical protein
MSDPITKTFKLSVFEEYSLLLKYCNIKIEEQEKLAQWLAYQKASNLKLVVLNVTKVTNKGIDSYKLEPVDYADILTKIYYIKQEAVIDAYSVVGFKLAFETNEKTTQAMHSAWWR